MREVSVTRLSTAIRDAVIRANTVMTPDIQRQLEVAQQTEAEPVARAVIGDLLENAAIAQAEHIPMCQDTGMVVVYLTFGQDVHWVDGDVEAAINEGIREGYLRFSAKAGVSRYDAGICIGSIARRRHTGYCTAMTTAWLMA